MKILVVVTGRVLVDVVEVVVVEVEVDVVFGVGHVGCGNVNRVLSRNRFRSTSGFFLVVVT